MQIFKGLRNRVVRELRISKPNDDIQVLSEAKGNGNIIRKQLNSLIKPKTNVTHEYELKVGQDEDEDDVNSFDIREVD